MGYRVDESTGILWRVNRDGLHPCVPESKVLSVLKAVHNEGGHEMINRSFVQSNTLYIYSVSEKHGAVRHFFHVLFFCSARNVAKTPIICVYEQKKNIRIQFGATVRKGPNWISQTIAQRI